MVLTAITSCMHLYKLTTHQWVSATEHTALVQGWSQGSIGWSLSALLPRLHTPIFGLVHKARSTIDHQFELPSVAQRTEREYIETMAGWVSVIVSTLT